MPFPCKNRRQTGPIGLLKPSWHAKHASLACELRRSSRACRTTHIYYEPIGNLELPIDFRGPALVYQCLRALEHPRTYAHNGLTPRETVPKPSETLAQALETPGAPAAVGAPSPTRAPAAPAPAPKPCNSPWRLQTRPRRALRPRCQGP